MILLIAAVAAFSIFVFWIHAEWKLAAGYRLLARTLLFVVFVSALVFLNNVDRYYDRGYVAEALRNIVEADDIQGKEAYLKMIEEYKTGKTSGGAFLYGETRRIRALNEPAPPPANTPEKPE